MTQEESWMCKYRTLMDFVCQNMRNPSKYKAEERNMLNWLKYNKKISRSGQMSPDREKLFEELLLLLEKYRRVNQYAYRNA